MVGIARGQHSRRIVRSIQYLILSSGLILYNWWIFVPLRPGLIRSPNELYSNLEITGQPYAAAMQHADSIAGILIVISFLFVSRKTIVKYSKEWSALIVFALFGSIGGIFTETCADEINAICRNAEWHFQLPLHHYIHMLSGIFEFAAITYVLYEAWKRTRTQKGNIARLYDILWKGAFIAYPLLGLAYLTDVWGAVAEALLFIGFTLIVWLHVLEWGSGELKT